MFIYVLVLSVIPNVFEEKKAKATEKMRNYKTCA